jgi:hypothetical protein
VDDPKPNVGFQRAPCSLDRVLDAHVHDRRGNQRLDDAPWYEEHAGGCEREG